MVDEGYALGVGQEHLQMTGPTRPYFLEVPISSNFHKDDDHIQ